MIYEIKKHFAVFEEKDMLFMLILVLQNYLGILSFKMIECYILFLLL